MTKQDVSMLKQTLTLHDEDHDKFCISLHNLDIGVRAAAFRTGDKRMTKEESLNEASVYAFKLRQYCISQSDCLSCPYHSVQGCKIGKPIGWDFLQEDKLDFWQTDLFKDGWQEGFGMGKQELAHAVMKLFETNGV